MIEQRSGEWEREGWMEMEMRRKMEISTDVHLPDRLKKAT